MPNSFYSFISRRNKYTAEKQHIQTPHIANVLQLIITCASFRPQLMRLRGINETINLNIVNCDSNGGVRALHHEFIRVLETALLHNNLALEIFCTCDVTLAPLPFHTRAHTHIRSKMHRKMDRRDSDRLNAVFMSRTNRGTKMWNFPRRAAVIITFFFFLSIKQFQLFWLPIHGFIDARDARFWLPHEPTSLTQFSRLKWCEWARGLGGLRGKILGESSRVKLAAAAFCGGWKEA